MNPEMVEVFALWRVANGKPDVLLFIFADMGNAQSFGQYYCEVVGPRDNTFDGVKVTSINLVLPVNEAACDCEYCTEKRSAVKSEIKH